MMMMVAPLELCTVDEDGCRSVEKYERVSFVYSHRTEMAFTSDQFLPNTCVRKDKKNYQKSLILRDCFG